MKNLFVLIILFCSLLAKSQNSLTSGNPDDIPRVVKPPFYHVDALRNSAGSWYEQKYTGGQWKNFQRIITLKNSDGHFTEISAQSWVTNTNGGAWNKGSLIKYSYVKDGQGQITELVREFWGTQDGTLKTIFSYANGKMTGIDFQVLSNGNYSTTAVGFYVYDGNGNRIKDSTGYGTSWQVANYTYDGNNRCILKELFLYNPQPTLANVDSFFYDNMGRLARTATGNSFETYSYNSAGDIENYGSYAYNGTMDTIIVGFNYKHTYNSSGKITSIVSRKYFIDEWENEDSLVNTFDANGDYDTGYHYRGSKDNWVISQTEWKNIYGFVSNGINNPQQPDFDITSYPNPAVNEITIELTPAATTQTVVHLLDLAGREIKSQTIQVVRGEKHTLTFDTQELAPGVYLVRAGNTTLKWLRQ